MSEKLIIKNFGPIKEMTLELRVINILIGDQSTGKSTVAKLLSAIKEVIQSPGEQLQILQSDGFNEHNFKEQLEIQGIKNYLKSGSYIEFTDSFARFKYENQKIAIKEIATELKRKHSDVIGYIPAYREAAILLKDSLNAIAAVGAPLPKLFYFFGQRVINAKKAKGIYNYSDILDIKYKYINDRDIIILKNGEEIAIEEASSAINSGIPLLLAFDNAVESMYPTTRIYHKANRPFIIIEEPELNCFPTTQKKIMEYFISKIKYETDKVSDYYCQLIITTHSPYMLTSLNNMMYAYEVGEKEPEATSMIINKKYWLNPNDVAAYMLLPDGTCENIFDREENLIMAEKIDSVSGFLNEQFDALLNIELVEK